jgi:hypothetical protein
LSAAGPTEMSRERGEAAAEQPFSAQAGRAHWLAAPSRFAAWPRSSALLALALLVFLELAGVAPAFFSPSPDRAAPTTGVARPPVERTDADLVLYDRIIAAIREGQDYYTAAARELRAGGYPMRPFVAFRPPLLAETLATLSPFAALLLLRGLIAATIFAWALRLRSATGSLPAWSIACLLLAGSVALFGQARYLTVHEIWAGLLVALSLALRSPKHWVAAAVLGLIALLVRELALPYVATMAVAALWERRWREAAGWTTAMAIFAAALLHHAEAVNAVVTAADRASPGWTHLGDWTFFVRAEWLTGPLRSAPYLAAALAAPLALLGWAGWREPIAARGFAVLAVYAAMLMFFGRPDNFYWALLFAPLLLIGLAFAPRSLGELIAAARENKTPRRLEARGR